MNTQPEKKDNIINVHPSNAKAVDEFFNPVAPIDKTLSASQFLDKNFVLSHFMHSITRGNCIHAMELFANLRVEQAKEEWSKQNLNKL